MPALDLCFGLSGSLQRLLGGHRNERVQRGIQSFDTGDKSARKFDRRNSFTSQHCHGVYEHELREFRRRLGRHLRSSAFELYTPLFANLPTSESRGIVQ
jgi:hypothetical protein